MVRVGHPRASHVVRQSTRDPDADRPRDDPDPYPRGSGRRHCARDRLGRRARLGSHGFEPLRWRAPAHTAAAGGGYARLARQRPHPDSGADGPTDLHLVGNYAVSPHWADGHKTGYYPFRLLRDRCPCPECTSRRELDSQGVSPRHPPARTRNTDDRRHDPYLAGHRIVDSKGMVFGLVVRSRGLAATSWPDSAPWAAARYEYTSLLEDTRRQALDRLVRNATMVGANAILSMRFDSSELSGTMSEIVAYGTAVIVEPDKSAKAPTAVD